MAIQINQDKLISKEFADDIIQLLDYLYIDESALIGHEMGAAILRIWQNDILIMCHPS